MAYHTVKTSNQKMSGGKKFLFLQNQKKNQLENGIFLGSPKFQPYSLGKFFLDFCHRSSLKETLLFFFVTINRRQLSFDIVLVLDQFWESYLENWKISSLLWLPFSFFFVFFISLLNYFLLFFASLITLRQIYNYNI